MQIGDTVQVKADALSLWENEGLTPAILVHLGRENRFVVRDVLNDGRNELVVLDCCGYEKDGEGRRRCDAHPSEMFEPWVPQVPVAPDVEVMDGEPEAPNPRQDYDRETSVTVPVLGRIFQLGKFREDGGKIKMKVAGMDEFEVKGALAKPLGKFLEGLGIL